jgi:energy-coupling factor transporter ATP-binding protein EcfA2
VTQEMGEVGLADRVVALERGTAVFDGRPRELFADLDLVGRLQLGLPPAAEVALALEGRREAGRALPLTLDELVGLLMGSGA